MIATLVVLYALCTVILAIMGLVWLDWRWYRRMGAWAVLTCWAWPIWLLAGVVYGIVRLFLIATGKDD